MDHPGSRQLPIEPTALSYVSDAEGANRPRTHADRATEQDPPLDFDLLWQTEVLPVLRRFSGRHRRLRRQMKQYRFIFCPILALPLLSMLFADNVEVAGAISGLVTITVLLGFAFVWLPPVARAVRAIEDNVKEAALHPFCQAAGLRYEPQADSFDVRPFHNFSFHPLVRMNVDLEDGIAGRYNGVAFEVCEIVLRLPKDLRPWMRREYIGAKFTGQEGFCGLLLRLDCPKKFSGETYVQPALEFCVGDVVETGSGVKALKQRQLPQRIKLEDPRFEAAFNVYSSDGISARYLLTPTFMERLTALATRFGHRRFECAFVDGKILVAISTGKDQFELHSALSDPESLVHARKLAMELNTVFELIDAVRISDRTKA